MRDDASLSAPLYACCAHCFHPPLESMFPAQEIAEGVRRHTHPCWYCWREATEEEARREGDHLLGQAGIDMTPTRAIDHKED